MKRFYWLALLLLVVHLLPATSFAESKDPEDYELQYVSADKFLEIWSDHKIDQDRCKWISDRAIKAYKFVAQQESWKNQEPLYGTPLKFRVVDSLKTLGYAIGKNVFIVKDSYLDDELSEGTLAHELTHIQDKRQLKEGELPSFMLEGRALTNGHAYRMSLGQKDNKYDSGMAASAVGFTSDNAREILGKIRDVGWNMQAMGTFLVEYMRTRWNETGVPNVHARLSRMIENIGSGADEEEAFAKEFGKPFSALVASFGKYLDDTRENPEARLAGTMWENVTPAKGQQQEEE